MMNDMMTTVEETMTPEIEAQIQFEEWQRKCAHEDTWTPLESTHGKLFNSLWEAWFEEGTCK